MMGEQLFTLSVLFSVITGTTAVILSLLTREVLNRSPFGRAVFTLSVVMALFVGYHVIVLLAPGSLVILQVFKSATFTGVAIFVWLTVWSQYRLRSRGLSEVNA